MMRRAISPAIWRKSTFWPEGIRTTVVVRSFSVEDLGCQATRKRPGWYLKYSTSPPTGTQFMWTFVMDMKIEICNISSLRYSSSETTSVTTTRPSQGAKTRSASWMRTRRGSRKKATMKNQNSSSTRVLDHSSETFASWTSKW